MPSADRHFDLAALAPWRERMVLLDGLWLDPGLRVDRAFTRLGDDLARLLIAHGHDFLFTTARVGIADGGHAAASMHAVAFACAASPDDMRVCPIHGLPLARLTTTLRGPATPVLRGWLRLGAWVCGDPAWNPDADRAEIPLLLALSRLRSRHARRFLSAAA